MLKTAVALVSLAIVASPCFADDLAMDTAKAEAGDFDAMLRVGLAYLHDKEPKKHEAGIKWLELSATGGVVTAYYDLGAAYQDGIGVEKDGQKAVMYLTLAAELGEIRGMNRLAGIYYLGKIAPQDDISAIKWALCAASLGDEPAKRNLERMKSQISQRSVALGVNAALEWAKRRFGKNSKQGQEKTAGE